MLGIRIRRVRMFLGLPDLDPLVRGTDPDPLVRGAYPDPHQNVTDPQHFFVGKSLKTVLDRGCCSVSPVFLGRDQRLPATFQAHRQIAPGVPSSKAQAIRTGRRLFWLLPLRTLFFLKVQQFSIPCLVPLKIPSIITSSDPV